MRKALTAKIWEALLSVAPVAVLVLMISFTPLASLSWLARGVFLFCSILLVFGIGLFNIGADLAMMPMGKYVGEGLTKTGKFRLLVALCFLLGVLITVAEPDLSVLAGQVSAVVHPTVLIISVGIGVGLFLALSVLRMKTKTDLTAMLLFFYMILFACGAMLIYDDKWTLLPLAFDSGGVTTGPITVPFIMALGLGIAQTIAGRNAEENSFGLIALCSIGPILAVLLLFLFSRESSITYELSDYSLQTGFSPAFWHLLAETSWEVAKSLLLMLCFFLVLQCAVLHLPKERLLQIFIGLGLAFVGLVVFLVAVSVGFMPVGYHIGHSLASYNENTLLVFSLLLGMVVVFAEPAVQTLNRQVEDVTNGTVSRRQMMLSLSVGVGVSIMLSMLRLIKGIPILNYLVPGYLLSLGLSFFVPKLYTAIAFDSGGVASGPLTSSFILPMAVGACVALRGADDVLEFAFGLVAMVAMTPLITIQALGFRAVASRFIREKAAINRIMATDDSQIITFDIGAE